MKNKTNKVIMSGMLACFKPHPLGCAYIPEHPKNKCLSQTHTFKCGRHIVFLILSLLFLILLISIFYAAETTSPTPAAPTTPGADASAQTSQSTTLELGDKFKPDPKLDKQTQENLQNINNYAQNNFQENKGTYGRAVIDKNNEITIYDSENNRFAIIPPKYNILKDKEKFSVENNGASEDSSLYLGDNKFKTEKGSRVYFSEKDGRQNIELIGKGDIEFRDRKLEGIQNGKFTIDKNHEIKYAEYTSQKGGKVQFGNYEYNAKAGGKIIYDSEGKKLGGEKTTLSYKGNKIDSDKFSVDLDDKGNFKKVSVQGGTYTDSNYGVFTPKDSKTPLDIYYNKDILNDKTIKNGVSIPTDTSKYTGTKELGIQQNLPKIQLKGDVDLNIDNIKYKGSEGASTELEPKNGIFSVISNGKDTIEMDNGKHLVKIDSSGSIELSRSNLASSNKDIKSFGVEAGNKAYYFDEASGNLRVDPSLTINGKSSSGKYAFVRPLSDYEGPLEPSNIKSILTDRLVEARDKLFEQLKNPDLNLEDKKAIISQIAESTKYTKDYQDVASRLSYAYQPAYGDPKLETFTRLKIAELGSADLNNNRFQEVILPKEKLAEGPLKGLSYTDNMRLETDPDSLHYKIQEINGKKYVTGWSPDGKGSYYSLDTRPEGITLNENNQKLLDKLSASDGSYDTLANAAKEREVELKSPGYSIVESQSGKLQSPLDPNKYTQGSEEYSNLQSQYRKIQGQYSDIMSIATENKDSTSYYQARIGSSSVDLALGDYKSASNNFNKIIDETSNKEIQSQALRGRALSEIGLGEYADAKISLSKAIELNPENSNLKNLKEQLSQSYFQSRGEQFVSQELDSLWKIYSERNSPTPLFGGSGTIIGSTTNTILNSFNTASGIINSQEYSNNLDESAKKVLIARLGFDALSLTPTGDQQRLLESDFFGRKQIIDANLGNKVTFNDAELEREGIGISNLANAGLYDNKFDSLLQKRWDYLEKNFGTDVANSDRTSILATKGTFQIALDKGVLDWAYNKDANEINQRINPTGDSAMLTYNELTNYRPSATSALNPTALETVTGAILTADTLALTVAPNLIGSRLSVTALDKEFQASKAIQGVLQSGEIKISLPILSEEASVGNKLHDMGILQGVTARTPQFASTMIVEQGSIPKILDEAKALGLTPTEGITATGGLFRTSDGNLVAIFTNDRSFGTILSPAQSLRIGSEEIAAGQLGYANAVNSEKQLTGLYSHARDQFIQKVEVGAANWDVNHPPFIANGRVYEGHAAVRMDERRLFPTVVDDAIISGQKGIGNAKVYNLRGSLDVGEATGATEVFIKRSTASIREGGGPLGFGQVSITGTAANSQPQNIMIFTSNNGKVIKSVFVKDDKELARWFISNANSIK